MDNDRCEKCSQWDDVFKRCVKDLPYTQNCIDDNFREFKPNQRWKDLVSRVLDLPEDHGAILGGWLKDQGV